MMNDTERALTEAEIAAILARPPTGSVHFEIATLMEERARLAADLRRAREALWDAATLVEEYSCRTPVAHIATECEEVVRRARAALGEEPADDGA